MRLILIYFFLIFIFPGSVLAHKIDNQVTIHIQKDGFLPRELKIKQGETVIFENIDTNPHWPASNIHPTHDIYPQFDPGKAIDLGQTWSFKFDRAGVWNYHDHLHPQLTGQIEVSGSNQVVVDKSFDFWSSLLIKIKRLYFKLFPQNLDQELAKVNMVKLADDEARLDYFLRLAGIKKTFAKLLEDSGNGSKVDCHQQAHKIGRLAYKIYGADSFKDMDTSCHSGVIHGAMEAFLREKGTQHLSEDVDKLCNNFSTSFGRFECLHGVGHGVLAHQSYDMPQALAGCQSLKDDYSRQSCFGGVFMENIIVSEGNGVVAAHQTKWVSSDPYFPCSGIDQSDIVQSQCFLMQTSRMLDMFKFDFTKVSQLCEGAPQNMRSTCFQSLGRDGAGQSLRNPQKITEICSLVPNKFYTNCLQGGLFVIVDFWGENMVDQPHQLCKLQSEQYKNLCYSLLAGRLPELFGNNKDKIVKSCQYNEDGYKDVCLKLVQIN